MTIARAEQERAFSREVAAERTVARVAARQHGVVTTEQLQRAGFGRTQLTRRVEGGWLVRLHVGVYQLGVFPGPWGPEVAALLACGPGAVLSHWTAARIYVLTQRGWAAIDISFEGRLAGRRPGIRPHRALSLPPGDVVLKHGMRVTTPARTLLDLAAAAPRDVLERMVEEALVQRLASPAELQATLARGAGRPGARKLREIVEFLDEPLFTRSEAEKRLVSLVRSAGLAQPLTNVRRAGWEVDAVWDAQGLVVEVDGHKYHSTSPDFERDRRKDADLMLAGYRVLRFTWRRITKEPARVIAIIAAALAPAHQERSRRG